MGAPPRTVWPVRAILGEGPVYAARENAVYFVDIKKPALHRLGLDDERKQSWAMPEPLGWVVERSNGEGFIAGFKSGFAKLSLDPFKIEPICAPEPERPQNRRNDAKADKWGRIWAGSMDDAETMRSGALTRLDPDLSYQRIDDGYGVCNGPAFNLAGDVMFHTDSADRVIYAFDLSPHGAATNKRVHIRFAEDWGYPDGMATDAEDGLWVCHWDGARISRFFPDGTRDRAIAMPVSRVTSCCFAGPGLNRLFVTTASIGAEHEALAGALFEVDPGVVGAPAHAFAG